MQAISTVVGHWLSGPSANPLRVLPDRLLSSAAGRMDFCQTVRLDLTSGLNRPNRHKFRRWLWQRWLSSRTTPFVRNFIVCSTVLCHFGLWFPDKKLSKKGERERWKWQENEEEDIRSYWMTLRTGEGGSSRSHYVEESFWRRLWTSRRIEYWMNEAGPLSKCSSHM